MRRGEADAGETGGEEYRRAEGEAAPFADGLRGEGIPIGAGQGREARGVRREDVELGKFRRRDAMGEESRNRRRSVQGGDDFAGEARGVFAGEENQGLGLVRGNGTG